MAYIIARTAARRPSLQHQTFDFEVTVCGLHIEGWSQHQMAKAIPTLLCQRCNKQIEGKRKARKGRKGGKR